MHVEDHPLDYANFEGIIPKGNYGAGNVEIYDSGNFAPLENLSKGNKKGHIKILLNGKKYKGIRSLVKTDDKNWLIIKSNDDFASEEERIKTKSNKNPFSKCSVQLATLTDEIPKSKEWIFEIKYDGYRITAFMQDGKTTLLSRSGQDYTNKFSSIAKSLSSIRHNFVIDGEVVSFDENGRSDFGLLQSNIKRGKQDFVFVAFDCLALNGKDLREEELLKRKEILKSLLTKCPPNIVESSFVEGKGRASYNLAKKLGLEGIVAKNIHSLYKGIRSEDWLKIKCYKRQEFVIGGYVTTDKNPLISAILVGYYDKSQLIFAGKVGTGFNEETKKELNKKFKKITTKNCPFEKELKSKENITYLSPELIAEIQYAEMTKSGVLRQPSFIGLREDKKAKEVVLEEK